MLDEPVLIRPGDWSGLRRALARARRPRQLLDEVKAAERARPRRRRLPGRRRSGSSRAQPPGDEKFIVANGDEGDPGSYIDKYLMERNPALLLEGMALAGYAVGAAHGFVLVPLRVPAARSPRSTTRPPSAARAEGLLGDDILGSGFSFDVTIVEGAGSYVVGEETALLACLQGLRGTVSARPPFPAERGVYGLPTVVNNVETLCNMPFIARARRRRLPRAQPAARRRGSKLVCFNERFARPGVYEVPLRHDGARALRGRRRRPASTGARSRRCRSAARSAGILPASQLDTPFDFDALAAEGCMVGHGGDRRLRRRAPTCARSRAPAALRRATRAAASASPAGSACSARTRCSPPTQPVDRARLEELLETLELGSLCAHGGGMPAPIRSLLAHFPEELGLALMQVTVDGDPRVEVEAGHDGARGRRARRAPTCPTLCFDERQAPFGACRVCLVGVEGAAGTASPACTTPCRDGMVVDTRDPTARRVVDGVVELVLSELPEPPARAHRARRGRRAARRRRAALARRRPRTTARTTTRHPYLAFQHELCISCGRCVRACDEVQGAFALTATGRGFDANVTAGLDAGFRDSTCVSCGACADTCPTDAITEITLLDRCWRLIREVSTTSASTRASRRPAATAASAAGWRRTSRDGRIVSISPALDGPANGATPASRAASPTSSRARASGYGAADPRGGELPLATWDEALARIAARARRDQGRRTAPTRSRASRPRAPPTRTAT